VANVSPLAMEMRRPSLTKEKVSMRKFVAIDAGGTHTRCWVADEQGVLGRASCGTVKRMVVGEQAATERLISLVRSTANDAGVALDEIAGTCIGLAGLSSGDAREWGERTLRSVVSGTVLVVGDEDIALEAAFRGGPGVFLIAGTGSIMTGRCSDGRRFGAGGFGPVLGDEGAAGWIGLECVRAALRTLDRGEATIVIDEVMAHWQLHSLAELIAKGNDSQRANFSELAGVIASCGERDDVVACDVLRRAGEWLAEQALLVVKKMRAAGCDAGDCTQLAYTGSVVGKIAQVREAMIAKLPDMDVAAGEVEAIDGALWLARKL
jgi:glucosamine kinase